MFWFHHSSHAEHLKKVAICFFLLSLALLAVIFYISFSWATITVVPRPVAMHESFLLTIAESPSGERGVLKGFAAEEDGDVKGLFLPSGEEQKGQKLERAKGSITVVNQSSSNQRLVATTRMVAPDGTLFRSTGYAVIPAKGRLEVPVIADEAKEMEELSSARFTLPGLREVQRAMIYGIGFTPAMGVREGKKTVLQSDIDAALASLQKELTKQTERALSLRVKSGDFVETAFATSVQPISIEKSAEAGESAESFTLRLRAHVQAAVYDRRALYEEVTAALLSKLPPGYDLVPPLSGAVSAAVDSIDAVAKTAAVKVVAGGERIRNADSPDFDRAVLSGMSAEGIVESLMRRSDEIESVDVQFYPFWVTRAPYLTDHITILLKRS